MNKWFLFFLLFVTLSGKLHAQILPYTSSDNAWNPDSLGNHRARVRFEGSGNYARVIIPWRRPDNNPAAKRIIVQDEKTGKKVMNVKTGMVNNESGEIFFEPLSGTGDYFVYFMPYRNEGRSNYPRGTYLMPENTASEDWLNGLKPEMAPNTEAVEIQSINAFNSFYPMQVIATEKETGELISKTTNPFFIVFPENRFDPIIMKDRLPYRWTERKLHDAFSDKADRGEFFVFQLGVLALKDLEQVTVRFSELKNDQGVTIPATKFNCFNTGGNDYTGKSFTKDLSVPAMQVQALWCGIDIPVNAKPGIYQGTAIVTAKGAPSAKVQLEIRVTEKVLTDGGISEPLRQTRLKWLNSTLAQDNKVIAPYTPIRINNNRIGILGRTIELGPDGLIRQVNTFFNQEMTGYRQEANPLFVAPTRFHFLRFADGKEIKMVSRGLYFTKKNAGTVEWMAESAGEGLRMEVKASLEFDGFVSYQVRVEALKDMNLSDISMELPFRKKFSAYMMGLGQKGGYRPPSFDWKWNVATKNQDGAWIGSVNAGLQYSLRDEKYVRPLNTNFYLQKPLLLPVSWGNDNKGGIKIHEQGDTVLVSNYSGARTIKKGEVLFYNFTLLITPFHPIHTEFQWATRFYHKYAPPDSIRAIGANVVNIHHATPINPWLNYPFIEYKKMKDYIDEAHKKGLKVKIYNTVRELSNRAYELFPLRSLGQEVYSAGKGGGYSWLQEHFGEDYIAAWFVPELKDAAILNSGMSRWHNYYVEGMNWLVRHVGIDGIYIDDVAFDRVTMKRVKRVLTQDGHPGIIDLHSANQFNKNDGFNNSANLYMEHFPFLNRLWFGEYFDYEKNKPDFFLTEVSGIPFGLMGEMLQDGGNAWRGMIYGMTNRMPWSDNADPRPLWKAWDDFGMKGSKMIGYWSDRCPVKTSDPAVLATVYQKKGKCLVSLASWADTDVNVTLQVDWKKLGIDPARAHITAPLISNFQVAHSFGLHEQIPVPRSKGWLLVIEQK
jgi:hypothetical protein